MAVNVRPGSLDELATVAGGVVPIVGGVDVLALEARCDAHGRPMLLLDTSSVTGKESLMDAVGQAFALPGWFGRSWESLAECLADVPAQTLVVWDGWTAMARAAPRETELVIEIFAESGLTVLLINAPEDGDG
jgi:hypothetical protein